MFYEFWSLSSSSSPFINILKEGFICRSSLFFGNSSESFQCIFNILDTRWNIACGFLRSVCCRSTWIRAFRSSSSLDRLESLHVYVWVWVFLLRWRRRSWYYSLSRWRKRSRSSSSSWWRTRSWSTRTRTMIQTAVLLFNIDSSRWSFSETADKTKNMCSWSYQFL